MIQLEQVTKIHHRGETEVAALRGVTAAIPAGSFTIILGPSGSGKSTLLYLIGALDDPSGGEITVNGQALSALTEPQKDSYRRNDVGFIFQSFNLLTNITALDNVLIPYMPQGVSEEMRNGAKELLGQVGLADRMHHRPNQLSGGEQQRVAIARALLKKPSLILADEPTGELDSATGQEIFQQLRRLNEEHQTTVVVVTHDSSYLTETDNILRIRDGLVDDREDQVSPQARPTA